MKIVIINLPGSTDRRAVMEDQLHAFGLTATFFPATDGRAAPEEERRRLCDPAARRVRTKHAMTPGEFGVAMSHRRIFEALLDSDDPHWLILEDDVILTPRIKDALDALARIPHAWDILSITPQRRPTVAIAPVDDVFTLSVPRYSVNGGFGYLVSRSGAEKFLRYAPKIVLDIDVELSQWWRHGLKVCCLTPPAVDHDYDQTSIIHSMGRDMSARSPDPLFTQMRRRANRAYDSLIKRLRFSAYCRSIQAG